MGLFNKAYTWKRDRTTFARKLDVSGLKGVFAKRLTVEQGTRALFLQGGRYCGILGPGVYTFAEFKDSIAFRLGLKPDERTTVILVDAGEVRLDVTLEKNQIRTKDAITAGFEIAFTVKIDDPLVFLENYLKNREEIRLTDLQNDVKDELTEVARRIVGRYAAEELYAGRDPAFETEFIAEAGKMLAAKGLKPESVLHLKFDDGRYTGEILSAREEHAFDILKKREQSSHAIAVDNISTAEELNRRDNAHLLNKAELQHKIELEEMEDEQDLKEIEKFRKLQRDHIYQMDLDKQDVEARRLEVIRENERKVMENRSNVPVEVLLSVLDGDNANVKEIARLELTKRSVSLTPEQLRAMQKAETTKDEMN